MAEAMNVMVMPAASKTKRSMKGAEVIPINLKVPKRATIAPVNAMGPAVVERLKMAGCRMPMPVPNRSKLTDTPANPGQKGSCTKLRPRVT